MKTAYSMLSERRESTSRCEQLGEIGVDVSSWFQCSARQYQRHSPLLRLPPELRHLIFAYALGGKTFDIRYDRKSEMAKNTTVSEHALALLSVCRQIFAETALLPFSSNKFSALHPMVFNIWIKSFRPAFAKAATSVRIDIYARRSPLGLWYETYHGIPRARYIPLENTNKRLSSVLTSLKYIQIAFTAKGLFMEETGVKNEVVQQKEEIRGLYESANSGIKVYLTRTMQ
jgi:hypothetical protein